MRLSHPLHNNLLPPGICYTCDVCGKTLSTKLTLKRHKEQQHFQPLNSALCVMCNKVFRTLNSLNNHKKKKEKGNKGIMSSASKKSTELLNENVPGNSKH
ncbi:Similar to br: Broad-complex core protein isoform 6 (Drosophila melanogaster) [Cotesia congregata]|uniref:Similar to br: Broad-complex core protein isoform 6 (Drosophila melanogaster) n=1 Tax=Cotesia congregata TaxID=51543 RepID=A0A8J2N0B0_COTCN|nr:Similar to br: Broad-complex core protein isoform 6 (Drosophila melanogaster) [Cotesia congregata]